VPNSVYGAWWMWASLAISVLVVLVIIVEALLRYW
jgi:hypothetical protein